MDKCLFSLLCGVLLLCQACNGQYIENPSADYGVTFILDSGGATRTTAAKDEQSVHNACFYFVDADGNVVDAVPIEGNTVSRNFQAGTYKAYVVANCGFDENSFTTENAIKESVCLLSAEAEAFSMFAGKTFSVPDDKICTITAERLVSKVEIDKISIDFSNYPDYASRTFTIDSIYLINVAGKSTLDGSMNYVPSASAWINKRVYAHSSSDALLCDRVQSTVTATKPYAVQHSFYCYQNNTSSDTHSAVWSARYTRLVVACSIGTIKTYYPIDIVGPESRLLRNCRYVISELVITDLGCDAPDMPISGSQPFHFSSRVTSWAGTHTISEKF